MKYIAAGIIISGAAWGSSCLGPEDFAGNPPVLRAICDGNLDINFAIFYWGAHQDGIEFAVLNMAGVPVINPTPADIQEINQLSDSEYLKPGLRWQFGYRLGFNYHMECDGWNFGLYWTDYHVRSKKQAETSPDTSTILALWSAFGPVQGGPVFSRASDEIWKLQLNMIDLPFGRKFWVSRWMNLFPQIGLRYARVSQDLDIRYFGGSWSPRVSPPQPPLANEIHLDNIYKGTGLRTGIEGECHFGCGFNIYCNAAASLLYGCFKVEHNEKNRLAIPPYTLENILSTKERLRASRAILDLGLGLQWEKQFFDCKVGVITRLGWEQHLFFDQNQLWRVSRVGVKRPETTQVASSSMTGQNVLDQRGGSLDVQGFTLSFTIEY